MDQITSSGVLSKIFGSNHRPEACSGERRVRKYGRAKCSDICPQATNEQTDDNAKGGDQPPVRHARLVANDVDAT